MGHNVGLVLQNALDHKLADILRADIGVRINRQVRIGFCRCSGRGSFYANIRIAVDIFRPRFYAGLLFTNSYLSRKYL